MEPIVSGDKYVNWDTNLNEETLGLLIRSALRDEYTWPCTSINRKPSNRNLWTYEKKSLTTYFVELLEENLVREE